MLNELEDIMINSIKGEKAEDLLHDQNCNNCYFDYYLRFAWSLVVVKLFSCYILKMLHENKKKKTNSAKLETCRSPILKL